jgi:dephospho-CoA kinase
MLTIAITGGIGSGKTAVTDYLREKGFPIIDTDEMSHAMTAPGGKAIPYIRDNFGEAYVLDDGSLNRKAMRDLVYQNPEKMKLLEKGTTEVIQADVRDRIQEEIRKGTEAVFVAIPLFFEAEENPSDYDAIWSVIADYEVRIERVKARDGLSQSMIDKIMDKQVDDAIRFDKSTDIIDNSGSLNHLHQQVEKLLKKYAII